MRLLAALALVPALLFQTILALDAAGLWLPLAMLRLGLWLDAHRIADGTLVTLTIVACAIAARRRSRPLLAAATLTAAALLLEALACGASAFAIADAAYRRTRGEPFARARTAPADVPVADRAFAAQIGRARRWAHGFMADFDVPGMQVAVSVRGRVVWAEAIGFASIEERRALTSAMPMRIHSVTKPLTATLAAALAERGQIDLDAPVARLIPTYRFGSRVTPRQLATHTAGIRHYRSDAEVLNARPFRTSRERVAAFANDPLLFAPGTRYRYSSYGYVLLGAAIEAAVEADYLEALRRFVLQPAGMTQTRADSTRDAVRYYERREEGGRTLVPPLDATNRLEAGGLVSTADDLARFGAAFLRGRVVRPETIAMMLTPSKQNAKYAFGWELGRDGSPYHQGGSTGGMSLLMLDRDRDVAMAILCNSNGPLPPRSFPLPPHIVLRWFAE